jgi:hypothetical protein
MARVGRNDKCPCGSGKKHKHCCGTETPGNSLASRVMMGVVVVMLLGAAYAGFNALTSDPSSSTPGPESRTTPIPLCPGAVATATMVSDVIADLRGRPIRHPLRLRCRTPMETQ